jgi:hypothetical protein
VGLVAADAPQLNLRSSDAFACGDPQCEVHAASPWMGSYDMETSAGIDL